MKGILLTISGIITFIIISSCADRKKENEINSLISEWSGKRILLPKDMYFTVYGKDTIDYPAKHSQYSIVNYTDSGGCTGCKLQLQTWKEYISMLNSVSQEQVPVLFFIHPKKREELTTLLENSYFNHPVCIDEKNTFNRLNHFPSDMAFQTFLLDKEDKVIAIGNPIYNPKIRELYLKIISGKEVAQTSEDTSLMTDVSIDNTSLSLGRFNWKKEQKVVFTLNNTGNKLLAIDAVATSCSCTEVEYEGKPVRPGDSISLYVIYKAEHPEHFNKTITVHCNTNMSPLLLKIAGSAE